MSFKSLMFDDDQQVIAESAADAFRGILTRKLHERGCQDSEIQQSIDRLLAKPMGLELKTPDKR